MATTTKQYLVAGFGYINEKRTKSQGEYIIAGTIYINETQTSTTTTPYQDVIWFGMYL